MVAEEITEKLPFITGGLALAILGLFLMMYLAKFGLAGLVGGGLAFFGGGLLIGKAIFEREAHYHSPVERFIAAPVVNPHEIMRGMEIGVPREVRYVLQRVRGG